MRNLITIPRRSESCDAAKIQKRLSNWSGREKRDVVGSDHWKCYRKNLFGDLWQRKGSRPSHRCDVFSEMKVRARGNPASIQAHPSMDTREATHLLTCVTLRSRYRWAIIRQGKDGEEPTLGLRNGTSAMRSCINTYSAWRSFYSLRLPPILPVSPT